MINQYSRSGAPIPSNLSARQDEGERYIYKMFGLYRGFVVKTVYPEDRSNSTGRLEYVVRIKGHKYHGVVDVSARSGGVFNNHIRVAKEFNEADTTKISDSTYDEKKDGEHCWCIFVEGDGNIPKIIGWELHPLVEKKNKDFIQPSKSKGIYERYEFNGVEFLTDKDGNYFIKQVGKKKDLKGTIENTDGVGTFIKFGKEGNITFQIHTDFKAEWLKSTKVFNIIGPTGFIKVDTTSSGAVEINGSGGRAKFKGSKIALGKTGANGELLERLTALITELETVVTNIQLITVPTALGPSGPPINSASFATSGISLGTIKGHIVAITETLP